MKSTLIKVLGIVLVIAVITILLINRFSQENEQNLNPGIREDVAPTLFNLGGVSIEPFESNTGFAGDLVFTKDTLREQDGLQTPIVLFGQKLPKSPGQPQRINPNFEFRSLNSPIEIISAIDGVVVFIKEQPEAKDYEVFLSTFEGSNWVIGYDHVTDLKVKKGDKVKVGQKLGKAALERDRYYRYELQINHEQPNDKTTMICPTQLLDKSVKGKYVEQFKQLEMDWKKWYGKDSFDTNQGGCVKEELTVSESEGR